MVKLPDAGGVHTRFGRPSLSVSLAVAGFLVFSGIAVIAGFTKVLAISWIAAGAMIGGTVLGASLRRDIAPWEVVWGYGLASGAMLASDAVFIVPRAIRFAPKVGGVGLAAGLIAGNVAQTIGHRFTHFAPLFNRAVAEITAHALAVGTIIGMVYTVFPRLSLLLGVGIVSHKGPAGYAAARRLIHDGKPVAGLLGPAVAVGIAAIPLRIATPPNIPAVSAAIFGFGAGIFFHVGMDFHPECKAGGEVDEVADRSKTNHERLDELRRHAAVSAVLGGAAVVLAWAVLTV
jgi:ZIP family zinc transporter